MAEIQTNTQSGEMTQRFIEFVMMQAQNAALFLGQMPNPQGEPPEVNLEVAKMFIDQLVMIREKTRGNLSDEETQVLGNAISNLQMVFFEVSQQMKAGGAAPSAAPVAPAFDAPGTKQAASPEAAPAEPADAPGAVERPAPPVEPVKSEPEPESKKRFTKSYGS